MWTLTSGRSWRTASGRFLWDAGELQLCRNPSNTFHANPRTKATEHIATKDSRWYCSCLPCNWITHELQHQSMIPRSSLHWCCPAQEICLSYGGMTQEHTQEDSLGRKFSSSLLLPLFYLCPPLRREDSSYMVTCMFCDRSRRCRSSRWHSGAECSEHSLA